MRRNWPGSSALRSSSARCPPPVPGSHLGAFEEPDGTAPALLFRPVAARRSLTRVLKAPFATRHYRAMWNTLRRGVDPWENLRRYLFGGGDYPYRCRVRTPVGTVGITLFGPDDVLTLNEVF